MVFMVLSSLGPTGRFACEELPSKRSLRKLNEKNRAKGITSRFLHHFDGFRPQKWGFNVKKAWFASKKHGSGLKNAWLVGTF